jgi:DNA-binding MarR family transcriptional regulator
MRTVEEVGMALGEELGFRNPVQYPGHEALLALVVTAGLLAKEGDRVLRPLGLTDSQFNVLALLRFQSEDGSLDQSTLGRMLVVNRSNVTGLIDRMERSGWVERLSDRDDRRVKRVRLTAAGRRLLERADRVYFQRVIDVMGSLPEREREQLARTLEKVRSALRLGGR